jgi:hypothetical protein
MSGFRGKVAEVINRNTVVSLALEQGFNAFLPVYDGGIDFILYRESEQRAAQGAAKESLDDRPEVCRSRHMDSISVRRLLVSDSARCNGCLGRGFRDNPNRFLDRGPRIFAAEAIRCAGCRMCTVSVRTNRRGGRRGGCRGNDVNALVLISSPAL